MSPIGARHIAFVNHLPQLLVMRLAGRGIVSVQHPVALDEHSEPQPDLAVLRRRTPPYKESEPATDDVVLLIEVGDTRSLRPRKEASSLCAEAGRRPQDGREPGEASGYGSVRAR